ncbi:hypothetical protein Q5741_20170 [Paenibacillus sp. JX-17]|uniref:Uncharacterized protein n=1 Tax=Paenibacillus lacisoli TaxID=3064525 RepID=A0ABT9CHG1_9BACL|nr:hypothetical protein [Paenibacillus sp. JX-17]MDO7908706.1 hypothetical protein [Paenibacillus sp. JX-17]
MNAKDKNTLTPATPVPIEMPDRSRELHEKGTALYRCGGPPIESSLQE